MKFASVPAVIIFALTLLLLGDSAYAATRGTPVEASAMLQKAVQHYKAVGRKEALSDFTAGRAPFHDRDLYVVCIASDHIIVANEGFPNYVVTSADVLVDAKGNPLGKALWDAAAKNADGVIKYPMINPATRKMEDKTTFYPKVADDLLCGIGAYSVP